MSRIPAFLFGLVVGGALVLVGLKYHVVRANDGVHLVPKLTAQFSGAYVDVRQFGLTQWNDHRPLAAALVQAGKGHILQDSAGQSLHDSMHGVLDALSGEAAAQADQVFGRY